MKSYKDIDKNIILNAPEGAMWVYKYTGNVLYYKYDSLSVKFIGGVNGDMWDLSGNEFSRVQQDEDFIPLPNIEIPWEATADSVCPVPDGCEIKFSISDSWVYNSTHKNSELCWSGCVSGITAYKIIDEDYLASAKLDKANTAQEAPIHVPELEMHRAAYQAIKNAGFESPEELLAEHLALLDKSRVGSSEEQLINRLKFLQNLANEFPEIYDEVVAEMKVQFECYCEEKLND